MKFANFDQGLQPAHSGHFNIERDQIRLDLRNSSQRLDAICRRAGNDDLRVGCEKVANHLSSNRRIIDNQYANWLHVFCPETLLASSTAPITTLSPRRQHPRALSLDPLRPFLSYSGG